jgi:protein O-mannosyl-transferase
MATELQAIPTPARLRSLLQSLWLRCVLLATVGFSIRIPALQGALLWDDLYLIGDNPFMKSPLLIVEAFRHYLFQDSFSAHYRPVQNISFMWDYFFWNTNLYGFHLTNILLHVTSGVLLYFLLRKLLIPLWQSAQKSAVIPELAAFLVAFLWMVHPTHSAAIDYISGRADSLAFLFASASWLMVLAARQMEKRPRRIATYFLAIVCSLLALCSRESAAIWFGLFVLHLFLFEKGISRRAKLISLVWCFALIAVYAGLRQLPDRRTTAGPSHEWSASTRAVLMLRALGDYGRLMLFPTKLHMERTVINPANYHTHESWRESAGSEYLSLLGLGVLGTLTYGTCRKGPGQKIRALGAIWFLFAYLPISNLFELNATVAEHWLYLPSVGFLIFLAGCVVDLPLRYHKLSLPVVALAIVALSWQSLTRSADWVDPETFYKNTLTAGGQSTRIAVNLGQVYAQKGRYAEAEKVFRKILEISPDYPFARNDLAEALYHQGKTADAKALFALTRDEAPKTRLIYPRTWIAILGFAQVRHHEKDDDAALAILRKACADYPHTWELISLESEIVRIHQGPDAALRLVENFARRNRWHYGAAMAEGRLFAEKGETKKADAALRRASRLDVHDVEALNLIAALGIRQNRLDDAYRAQKRAVARQPDAPRQYLLLSDILNRMGREVAAKNAMVEVARLEAIGRSPGALAN